MNTLVWEDFEPQLSRLREVYGAKAYPPERADLIYRLFRYSQPEVVKATIEEVISEHMHAPAVSKIRDILYATRKKMGGGDRDPWSPIRDQLALMERNSSCGLCFGSGTLTAHRRDDPQMYSFAFLCTCTAGGLASQLPENKGKIHEWTRQHARDWKHHFEADLPPATRNEARAATSVALKATSMNEAIDAKPSPKRGYESEHWEPDL